MVGGSGNRMTVVVVGKKTEKVNMSPSVPWRSFCGKALCPWSSILLAQAKPVPAELCGFGSEKQSRWTLPCSHRRSLSAEWYCIISVDLLGKVGH